MFCTYLATAWLQRAVCLGSNNNVVKTVMREYIIKIRNEPYVDVVLGCAKHSLFPPICQIIIVDNFCVLVTHEIWCLGLVNYTHV